MVVHKRFIDIMSTGKDNRGNSSASNLRSNLLFATAKALMGFPHNISAVLATKECNPLPVHGST